MCGLRILNDDPLPEKYTIFFYYFNLMLFFTVFTGYNFPMLVNDDDVMWWNGSWSDISQLLTYLPTSPTTTPTSPAPTATPSFPEINDDLVLAALERVVEILQQILQLLQQQQQLH